MPLFMKLERTSAPAHACTTHGLDDTDIRRNEKDDRAFPEFPVLVKEVSNRGLRRKAVRMDPVFLIPFPVAPDEIPYGSGGKAALFLPKHRCASASDVFPPAGVAASDALPSQVFRSNERRYRSNGPAAPARALLGEIT
jgi:hypothetical protein